MEELWNEINKLKSTIEELQLNDKRKDNIIEGQRLDIEKFSKMARQIDMIKLSEVTKGQKYESNV